MDYGTIIPIVFHSWDVFLCSFGNMRMHPEQDMDYKLDGQYFLVQYDDE